MNRLEERHLAIRRSMDKEIRACAVIRAKADAEGRHLSIEEILEVEQHHEAGYLLLAESDLLVADIDQEIARRKAER